MKFSIIIPTYNSAIKIDRCIKSVLNQSLKDYEILIIDGKSTDNTIEIIESIRDQRIRLFSEKDKGVYDAMNKGINESGGEWLYFLGSDDALFDFDVLKNISNYIDNVEADVVYGNVKFVDQVSKTQEDKIYDGRFNAAKLFLRNICHQAIFYKKTFVKEVGYYNLKYPILADYDYNLRAWKQGKFKFIDLVIAEFSFGGLSSNIDHNFESDFLNNMVKYFYGYEPDSRYNKIGKGLIKIRSIIERIRIKIESQL